MAFTESNMMPLGTLAPDFHLFDTLSGNYLNFNDCKGKNGTLVLFICNHCPYVIHVNSELVKIANEYLNYGLKTLAISSNDAEKYIDDSPDKMNLVGRVLQFPFPYLYDETQEVAKRYDAACTPDIYLFDQESKLYYRGRLDDSKPKNNIPITGKDLRMAIDDMLNRLPPPEKQYPSGGCNIKWKG
jgi:peroxiredoxin